MIITISESIICQSSDIVAPTIIIGSIPSSMCVIDRYIKMIHSTIEIIRYSLSLLNSFSLFNISLYPALSTALESCSSFTFVSSKFIQTSLSKRLTTALLTPSILLRAFSTFPLQMTQVMPLTSYVFSIIYLIPLWGIYIVFLIILKSNKL